MISAVLRLGRMTSVAICTSWESVENQVVQANLSLRSAHLTQLIHSICIRDAVSNPISDLFLPYSYRKHLKNILKHLNPLERY